MTHIHKFLDEITVLLLHIIMIPEVSFQGEQSVLGCLEVVRGTCLRFERQTNSDAAIFSNIGCCIVMLRTLTIFFRHPLHSRNLFNFPEASKIQFHCNLKGLTLVGTHLAQHSSDHPAKDRPAVVKPVILLPLVQKEILVHIRAQQQLNGARLMEDSSASARLFIDFHCFKLID